ncbi:hypothetical protein ABW21_db0202451 [Orbilia brochopaga]|nr:hypothetical protein ABW21_db0202451 [Drechslerella brochopaga]
MSVQEVQDSTLPQASATLPPSHPDLLTASADPRPAKKHRVSMPKSGPSDPVLPDIFHPDILTDYYGSADGQSMAGQIHALSFHVDAAMFRTFNLDKNRSATAQYLSNFKKNGDAAAFTNILRTQIHNQHQHSLRLLTAQFVSLADQIFNQIPQDPGSKLERFLVGSAQGFTLARPWIQSSWIEQVIIQKYDERSRILLLLDTLAPISSVISPGFLLADGDLSAQWRQHLLRRVIAITTAIIEARWYEKEDEDERNIPYPSPPEIRDQRVKLALFLEPDVPPPSLWFPLNKPTEWRQTITRTPHHGLLHPSPYHTKEAIKSTIQKDLDDLQLESSAAASLRQDTAQSTSDQELILRSTDQSVSETEARCNAAIAYLDQRADEITELKAKYAEHLVNVGRYLDLRDRTIDGIATDYEELLKVKDIVDDFTLQHKETHNMRTNLQKEGLSYSGKSPQDVTTQYAAFLRAFLDKHNMLPAYMPPVDACSSTSRITPACGEVVPAPRTSTGPDVHVGTMVTESLSACLEDKSNLVCNVDCPLANSQDSSVSSDRTLPLPAQETDLLSSGS